jgi:outer membrane lipopolysaccharide assembly protein LptE/RlpB
VKTSPGLAAVFGLLFALLGFITGCSNYQLGTGATAKFRSIYVAPVKSDALIPQARVLVATQVREALLRDGRVTLADSPEQADAVLTIVLSSYNRQVVVSLQDDTGRARRFEVTLLAHATLVDTRTKQPYFTQRPLEAKRGVFTDSGLVPAEYEGLPLLAETLASETVHAVLDTW